MRRINLVTTMFTLGLLVQIANSQQATMQFNVERDTDILGWDNHAGWGDPPVFDKVIATYDDATGENGTEEFANHGAAPAIRGRKSSQHATIMDWNSDAIKSFLAANADSSQPMTWTLNIFPIEGPSADIQVESLESLNNWIEGDSLGTYTNFDWSEGTGAVTTNYAQTYYSTDAEGARVLDSAKSLPWVENQTGTGGINDNQYGMLGRPDNFAKGTRLPDIINSALLTVEDLGAAATDSTAAKVVLDSVLVNAILNDPNNRGIVFGPATGFPNENWRVWTKEGSGLLDENGGPTAAETVPGPVAPYLELTYTKRAGVPGDFNNSGGLDLPDVNLLNAQIAGGTNQASFDLNADAKVNGADLNVWVKTLRRTWFGDADLNGEFNSGDLVSIFTAGKYELATNATWDQGDWDGDLRFGSGDLVSAFQDGGYEKGPVAAVVPEPAGITLILLGLASVLVRRVSRPVFGN